MASRYPTVEVYQTSFGKTSPNPFLAALTITEHAGYQWRWRFKTTNGRIVADSAEGYQRRLRALQGAQIALGLKGIDQMQPGETKLVRRGSSKVRVVVLGR